MPIISNSRAGSWRRSLLAASLIAILAPLAAGCGDDSTPQTSGSQTVQPGGTEYPDGTVIVPLGDRPFHLYVPATYTAAQPVPLILGLHGYTSNSAELQSYFSLAAEAERRGFIVALPDGTVDRAGDQFWNASNACCDIYRSNVDDSAYLSQVIETIKQSYSIDAGRVFLIGHSNGGYMSHRMACDHADQITAIAALAGTVWANATRCQPSQPVSVLQIHGTADSVVLYDGGAHSPSYKYPGAEQTVATWRDLNGCTDVAQTAEMALDLDGAVDGPETTTVTYTEGCRDGSRVALWKMNGSEHVPELSDAFTPAVIDFFFAAASG